MSRLFGRIIKVEAGGLEILDHQVAFTVSASLGSDADSATISIYNLTRENRSRIEAAPKGSEVRISCGYREDGPSVIYAGNLRRVSTERQGPDRITVAECSSAFDARSPKRRLDKSYRKGTSLRTIVQDLIKATGAKIGNSADLFSDILFTEKFDAPYHASGPAWEQLTQIVESRGYRITTRGNKIFVSEIGKTNSLRAAALLSERTGLVGQPTVDQNGVLTCETLMLPGIFPGVLVQLRSEFVTGDYQVLTTEHAWSLYGQEPGIHIEARKI